MWSTEKRMQESVKSGLARISGILQPHVIITHNDVEEEPYFWPAIDAKARQIGISHITLPRKSADFMWLSRLDTTSLAGMLWYSIVLDARHNS